MLDALADGFTQARRRDARRRLSLRTYDSARKRLRKRAGQLLDALDNDPEADDDAA